jgi:hypothetical protein
MQQTAHNQEKRSSAVGVSSLLAPSSQCSRLLPLFCTNATTSGRVTISAEWMLGQPRPTRSGAHVHVKATERRRLPHPRQGDSTAGGGVDQR